MKKILVLVLAIMLTLGAAASAETLRVGMECDYAPFNWTQTDNSNNAVAMSDGTYAAGYDVWIAQKIADDLGMKLEIVKTSWDGLLPAVTSGKIDMIIAGMSPTAERKESIDFSNNYYTSDIVLVVKKDGPYASATSISDFAGAKLTAQLDTFHYKVLDQVTGASKQNAMEDFPSMIIALQSGKIDGYVSELPGAKAAVAANAELSYVTFEKGKGFSYETDEASIAVGVKKGSELTSKINAALTKISETERTQLMDKAIANQPLS